MSDVLPSHAFLQERGFVLIIDGYPPFFKKICVYFVETTNFIIGTIVMCGGGNRICLLSNGKYYDLDNYICYWRIEKE